MTRADGLPPNPYIPSSTSFGQTVPQAGFVQPVTPTRGTIPVVTPPSRGNNFNQPQIQPVGVVPSAIQSQNTILRFTLSARLVERRVVKSITELVCIVRLKSNNSCIVLTIYFILFL